MRIWRHCFFLALPTVLFLALSLYFLVVSVPHIAENERRWAESEARKVVERLKSGDEARDFVWQYGVGVVEGDASWAPVFPKSMTWKEWGGQGGRHRGEKWGWRDVGKRRVVWARTAQQVVGRATEIVETDYTRLFWFFGPLVIVLVIVIVALTLYNLISYARSRDDFLAAAAHDLRTPLAGLRYALAGDDSDASLLVERLVRLVGNIQEFQRHGRRRLLHRETFDVRATYQDAYRIFADDFRDQWHGEDVGVSGDGTLLVAADELATAQILWNLLGNALKYAAPHGRVAVDFSHDEATAWIVFADTGPGMTSRQRRRAFDRYYRARDTKATGKGGFGIGLCVARELARAMGGDLTVGANAPSGCVFTLSLPRPDLEGKPAAQKRETGAGFFKALLRRRTRGRRA